MNVWYDKRIVRYKCMKRIYIPALLLLLLSSLSLNGYYFLSQNHAMTVVDVHDGDTFTLGDGQRVRLLGADAPELGKCGSEESKNRLSSLVLGKTIQITEEKRDMYGRRMGLVYAGNTLVNEIMLRDGLARPDYTKNSQNEKLKAAYKEATENSRGIHSTLCKHLSPTPTSPNCTIKGNIDKATWEHFYHLPKCRHYNQIVLDEDIGEGFFLAPDCLR
jgi:endonuclease YncB( thermonuclease family)